MLKRLDPEVVESLLPLVAKADRQDIRTLLSYPEHSAGSVMTTEYATLTTDLTVSDAISRLRLQATSAETIYYVYVVDHRTAPGRLRLAARLDSGPARGPDRFDHAARGDFGPGRRRPGRRRPDDGPL